MSVRLRCFLVLASLSVFVVFIVAAAAVYPGGNYYDRSHPKHHFWYNFLCDLLHQHALGGGNNVAGARLATIGMLALVVSMITYFSLSLSLMPSRVNLGTACLVAGIMSSLGLVAVALTPSDALPRLHTAAIVLATAPGMVAVVALVFGRLSEPGTAPWFLMLGVLMLAAVAVTAVVFVVHTWFGGGFIRVLPSMQRVAAIACVLWIGSTTVHLITKTSRAASDTHSA